MTMTNRIIRSLTPIAIAALVALAATVAAHATPHGTPPAGFTSASARINGSSLHYVRGGHGQAVILLHGFPEDWSEYQAIMPELAKRFTVVAVDLGGYDAANIATQIHGLSEALDLDRPYLVGHDLGGIVAYAYIRQFSDSLRGAMIIDVPMPGVAGWDEATTGLWHIGFIQTPGLAEKLVPGRQDAFLDWFYGMGKFSQAERKYYAKAYRAPQLHSAFEIYRAFPKDVEWNAAQTKPNPVPLVFAVGAKSFFAARQQTFVDGYRAKGMTHVEAAQIPDASHYIVADNPDGVAALIEKHAAETAR
jgi:pimeloyl-ACP methyl ester carboxylesterase